MKTPYPHQFNLINELRSAFSSGYKSVLVQGATGIGKTVISSHVIHGAQSKGNRAIFCVHRDNLIKQTANTFHEDGIQFGLIKSGVEYDPKFTVHIASAQTLVKHLDSIEVPTIFFVDECHLSASTTYKTIIDYYRERGVLIVGCSGTPMRLDGKPLSDLFDTMVQGPSVRWLIDNGFLSEFKYYAPTVPDLSGIKKIAGDYAKNELAERLGGRKLVGDVISHYKKLAHGKITIVYCVNINHSEMVADQFNEAGIAAAHIDGGTPKDEQKRIFNAVADGEILVLCSVQLVTEGFDLAAQTGRDVTIECVILLRATHSLALYLQMIGRALRRKKNPAIILDHGGNVLKHGMPDDERVWSLDGKQDGNSSSDQGEIKPPIICESCYQAIPHPYPDNCPYCNADLKTHPKVIEIIEGELQEIKEAERLAIKEKLKQEEREAKTLNDFIAIAQKRGYKNPSHWANKKTAGRAMRHKRLEG